MKNVEIKSQIAELKDASRLHKRVINEIVEDAKDYDGDFTERLTARLDDNWDEEDPLCREQQNQTLLAWFAYQVIASQLRNLIEA